MEKEKHELMVQNVSLTEQLLAMQSDEKSRELEIAALRKENERLRMDEAKYEEWNHQISSWILSLDNGRYAKYEKMLRRHLEDEEVDGTILGDLDVNDFTRWGIKKLADIKYLQKEIARLRLGYQPVKQPQMGVANASPAPAFSPMSAFNPAPNEGADEGSTHYVPR